ncbi:putative metal transport system membrane protein CT_070 [Waddlia chondrophila 2032/99]|uniref:Putative metal transport system membrane protein CT_070 n=1 Tax=Waddlia chondrophila 2032/99 TaxID=765953 RepID=F8LF65_9BACT|nr:putative metal transport system membrane protein CT_070 [Waddlia chondrophila 2032/99]
MHAINPYMGQNFLSFIAVFAMRMRLFFTGQLGIQELVSDEIQVFVLAGVAVSSSLLGCYLVLRKMTMLANALSHTILLGIVVVYFFSVYMLPGSDGYAHLHLSIRALLAASLLMGIVTTFLTEFLTKSAGLQEDASIGIVFTSLFALGIILVTLLTRNAHIGTEIVMGNADALRLQDLKLVLAVLFLNIALIGLFYKEYAITTFDSGLSKTLGFSPVFFNYLLMTQVSATAIGGFRAVGVLMVLALMTGPSLIARLLTNHLRSMLLLSAAIGIFSAFVGVALSRHFLSVSGLAFSTGGVVVCVIIALFLTVLLMKRPGL